jgi:hypothetical protein
MDKPPYGLPPISSTLAGNRHPCKNSKIHQVKKEDPSFTPPLQEIYNHICKEGQYEEG